MDHRLHVRLSILLIFLFSSLAVHATDVTTIYTVNFTEGLDWFSIQDDILLNGNSAWQQDNKYGMKASGYSNGNYNGIQHNTSTLNGSFWSFLSSMFSSISNLLHIELYDGITIGVVIMIPLLFTILMLILKLVRG